MSANFPIDDDPRFRVSTATEGQKDFVVPFPFQGAADIAVWREGLDGLIHVLDLGVDYLISGAGQPAGGTVTLAIGAIEGERIYRVGEAVLERKQSVVRNGKFSSEALDQDLDRTIISLQEFRRDVARSWVVAFGQQAGTIQIGAVGRSLMFDINGNVVPGPASSDIASAQANAQIAAAAEAYLRSIEARLTIVASIEADVTTVAQVASHVPVVASIADDVQTLALIAPAVAAVADIDDDVQTVAANIAAIIAASEAIPHLADKLNKDASNIGNAAAQAAFRAAIGVTKWAQRAIGEIVWVDTSKAGVEIPPFDAGFIELSTGLNGSGAYNEGKLSGATASGSGATLTVTATIVDVDSPMNGQVINLINTEQRVFYAAERASSGQVFNDQMQKITGSFVGRSPSTGAFTDGSPDISVATGSGAFRAITFDSANSPGARTGDRTRAKGINRVAFLKYKDVA